MSPIKNRLLKHGQMALLSSDFSSFSFGTRKPGSVSKISLHGMYSVSAKQTSLLANQTKKMTISQGGGGGRM